MPNQKNKVKFGLKNVHYAPLTFDEHGNPQFGEPKPLPGAVNLSLSAQGDTEKFYADNVAYFVSSANEGYQGDLELALIPDDFRRDILGDVLDDTSKVLVEHSNAVGKSFSLLYQFAGDQRESLRVLYNCTAARPAENGSTTNNTRTPNTDTLTITASPLADGMVKAKTTDETPDAVRRGWFAAVWRPTAPSEEE